MEESNKALLKSIRNNTITYIRFSRILSENDILIIAKALKFNTSVKELDLSGQNISVKGVKAIAESLLTNTSLTTLDLWGNTIGVEGGKAIAKSLLTNTSLTKLDLSYNGLDNLLSEIEKKLQCNIRIKEQKNKNKKENEKKSSPFFVKIMERDDRNIIFKLDELCNLIEDVHQAKIFYTLISVSHKMQILTDDDRVMYTKKGLEIASKTCTSTDAVVILRFILDRALVDGAIDLKTKRHLKVESVVKRVEHSDFIKDIRASLKVNTARIEGLEGTTKAFTSHIKVVDKNLSSINDSLNELMKGIKYKMKVEACVCFIGAILNAFSFGVAGSAVKGVLDTALSQIVDFSDVVHMKLIAEDMGDVSVKEAIDHGLSMAETAGEKKLSDAVENQHTLAKITAVAALFPTADDVHGDDGDKKPAAVVSSVEGRITALPGLEKIISSPTAKANLDDAVLHRLKSLEDVVGVDGEGGVLSRIEKLEDVIHGEKEGDSVVAVSKMGCKDLKE